MIPITAGMTGAQYLAAINNIRKEYNVKDYGNFIAGAVSEAVSITNTETLQAAINAVYTAGGGKIMIPNGLYKIGGPLQTSINSTNPNCQIYIPLTRFGVDNGCHITIEGESSPNFMFNSISGTVVNITGGVILESTINGSGTLPAVFGTPTYTSALGAFNHTYITLNNFIIRTKTYDGADHVLGTMSGINFENMSNFQFDQLSIEITSALASMVEPTNETHGMIFPKQLNFAWTIGGTARIMGYKYGVVPGEHLNVRQFYLAYCNSGLYTKNTFQHGAIINCLSVEGCAYNIQHKTNSNILIESCHSEYKDESEWTDSVYNVYINGATTRSIHIIHANRATFGVVGGQTDSFDTNDPNLCSIQYLNGRNVDLDMITLVTTNTWKAIEAKRAKIVLTGNSTLTINNAKTGEVLELLVIQDGTGGHSLTINTILVTTEQAASAATLVKCTYDGTTWRFF